MRTLLKTVAYLVVIASMYYLTFVLYIVPDIIGASVLLCVISVGFTNLMVAVMDRNSIHDT